MDRLYESAAAINPVLLSSLYQISLMEFHLDCARTEAGCYWPVPPPNPRSQPHLYHNDSKVLTSIIRCKEAITLQLEDERSTFAEHRLVLNHPVWKNIEAQGIKKPVPKRQPLQ